MSSDTAAGQGPTLHTIWRRMILRIATIAVVLGGVTMISTQYQRTTLDRTTTRLDSEMAALVDIDRANLVLADPLTRVLYQVDGPEAMDSNVEALERAVARMDEAFSGLGTAFAGSAGESAVAETTRRWTDARAAALGAPALWEADEVNKSFLLGVDPFAATVWQPLGENAEALTNLRADSVLVNAREVESVSRVHDLIPVAVVLAMAIAVVLAWRAARELNERVLSPLMRMRDAAVSMRTDGPGVLIDLQDAATEVGELADSLNQTSTSLHTTHAELRDRARRDPLTGLGNRAAFRERLTAELGAPGASGVAVLFVDLDDFKVVNDLHGHAAGDELLCMVADRLRLAVREHDAVARLGGDEFAVTISGPDAASLAAEVAQRILSVIHSPPIRIGGSRLPVGCSIGVAAVEPVAIGEQDPSAITGDLLRNADFAMYTAKSQGKNRYELFAASQYNAMLARSSLRDQLLAARASDELFLEYQPVVDLEDGSTVGLEALLRWAHPTRGRLAPGAFLELAEETGEIVPIGLWVIDKACATLADLRTRATGGRDLWMSVNASPSQLTGSHFVRAVLDALERHSLPPESLVVEVTESAAMTNTEVGTVVLDELRRAGVHVALDDFGVGFSSLQHLSELPVDVLKIDRSFVLTSGRQRAEAMLEMIAQVGHRLGMQVIAEGIETREEAERVERLGVRMGQGFHFARPAGHDRVLEMLDADASSVGNADRHRAPGSAM